MAVPVEEVTEVETPYEVKVAVPRQESRAVPAPVRGSQKPLAAVTPKDTRVTSCVFH